MKEPRTISNFLSILVIVLLCIGCKPEGDFIPEKSADFSQGKYEKYLGLLKEAYADNDKFQAAIQYSNLKVDKKRTYNTLNEGIRNDPNNCDRIYEWYWLYDENNFRTNILKLDTTLFKESVTLCDELYTKSTYAQYLAVKRAEAEEFQKNKVVEDSSGFNIALVEKLKQIEKDDQDVRNRLSAKTTTKEQAAELRIEMQRIDSINLLKIDKIFKEHGYPSRELVGKDGNFTPALVIHHSNSLEDRYKYLPLLEKAVEDGVLYEGTLNMIKRRIENIKLDKNLQEKP
jgi:hypothetical protein